MPYWVDIANKNKHGLNLSYVETPQGVLDKIKNKNNHDQRYIIRISDRIPHSAVIDVKSINGKPSILFFESSKSSSDASGMLTFNVKLALEKVNLSDRFCVVELDIQRSHYDCAMFSLAIAKKIHKHEEAIYSLHKFIADNKMTKPNAEGFIRKNISDKFLPADFYKHTQSKYRIQEYLKANPENKNSFINKKMKTSLMS